MLDWTQDIFLVFLWVTLSVIFLLLLNYFWDPRKRRVHNDVIGWQIAIIGTIYAVMIGFMLYAVWANFQTADTNVNAEANSAMNLFHIADGLPTDQRDAIQIATANYVNAVLHYEWATMNKGAVPYAGHRPIVQLWTIVTQTPVQTQVQQASLAQAMHELSDLTKHRRIRILESRTQMPTILWTVLVIGGMITIASCCVIGSENLSLHLSLIIALSLLISLALVAIGDIDTPFQGAVHVSPHAFIQAQQEILSPGSIPRF